MERKLSCLRCGTELECLGRKALEGGLGLVNSLDVEVYECPN